MPDGSPVTILEDIILEPKIANRKLVSEMAFNFFEFEASPLARRESQDISLQGGASAVPQSFQQAPVQPVQSS